MYISTPGSRRAPREHDVCFEDLFGWCDHFAVATTTAAGHSPLGIVKKNGPLPAPQSSDNNFIELENSFMEKFDLYTCCTKPVFKVEFNLARETAAVTHTGI